MYTQHTYAQHALVFTTAETTAQKAFDTLVDLAANNDDDDDND
jgi:hypothetical protein